MSQHEQLARVRTELAEARGRAHEIAMSLADERLILFLIDLVGF